MEVGHEVQRRLNLRLFKKGCCRWSVLRAYVSTTKYRKRRRRTIIGNDVAGQDLSSCSGVASLIALSKMEISRATVSSSASVLQRPCL